MSAAELAELLRARRARVQPGDVGLPTGARRRTAGLRREEVAALAGISTSYYTYLEQGRELHPSAQVLDALARALRLDPTEHAHLRRLAGGTGPARVHGPETLPDGVADLVRRLDPDPTYVTGRCWDVLAANRAARLLWADFGEPSPERRNMLVWTFLDPRAREVLVDWEPEARAQLARFRAASASRLDAPDVVALVQRLVGGSAEARRWWAEVDVAPLGSVVKRVRHRDVGVLTLRNVVLQVAENPDLKLVTFDPGQRDRARIAALLAGEAG